MRNLGLTQFAIAFVLFFPSVLQSQPQEPFFTHISLEAGLSQAAVNVIEQDSYGFMWFGTLDGLNRYDGYSIKVYKTNPSDSTSLSHNKVMALCADSLGGLWVGTDGGGLNRFNPETETFTRYRYTAADSFSISNNRIRAIYALSDGILWIGSFSNGVDRFDPLTKRFKHYPNQTAVRNKPIEGCIMEIYSNPLKNDSLLWLGTYGGGMDAFDIRSERYRHFRHEPANPQSLSHGIVLSIYADVDENSLWIGTYGGGLNNYHLETDTFRHFRSILNQPGSLSSDMITAVYADPSSKEFLWIATEDGLNRFNKYSGEAIVYRHDVAKPSSLNNNRIRSISRDRSGSIWFGTMGGGVNQYSLSKRKFVHYSQELNTANSLNDNFVRSIFKGSNGVLWIGSGSGGLNKLTPGNGHFSHYLHDPVNVNSLSNNSVRAVYEDRYGILWLGTDGGGMDRFDPITSRFNNFRHNPDDTSSISHDKVWVVCEDTTRSKNVLWLGTYGGGLDKVVLVETQHGKGRTRFPRDITHYQNDPVIPASIASNSVLAICIDREGTLWVGTGAGLGRLDSTSSGFVNYQHNPADPTSLSNNTVITIYEDQSGTLWVGTFGGGLNKLNRENATFQRYSEQEGLPSNIINGICEDSQGNLWISTYNGLVRFNLQDEVFRRYDVGDGIQSNEFGYGAYHQSKDGWMYFGGINGFNMFHPDSIIYNKRQPPVMITDFSVLNKTVPLGAAATYLKNSLSRVNASRAAIRRIELSHKQNVFSFEFAALDYTAPEKNRYAYKLEGLDADWIYSDNRRYAGYAQVPPGEYVFRVRGSNNDGIWNNSGTAVKILITPPFWGTLWFRFIIAISLATLLYMLHKYRVAKAVEMERLRVRIASDLHDDLGSTLTKISIHSEIIQNTKSVEKISRSSQKIGEMSREIITSLSDIIWSIDARNDQFGDLLDRMHNFALSVFLPKEIQTVFDVGKVDSTQKLPVDIRQNVYLIFKEAINNIARHANATEVKISFTPDGSDYILQISDNGIGLSDSTAISGSGLRNMQMRSERIGATVHYLRSEGLTVILRLRRLSG